MSTPEPASGNASSAAADEALSLPVPDMKFIIIGGSWGSLDPIIDILADLPTDMNAALLIVRHTAPDSPARLPRVLRHRSSLPVSNADDGMRIEPGRVYVAKPGCRTELEAGVDGQPRFAITAIGRDERPSPNIDRSLISGAELFDDNCISVILSGYLDDGTRGAKALASHHGVTIVQLPAEAKADSMPLNVIHRDSPDLILRGHQISRVLCHLAGSRLSEALGTLERLA